MTLRRVVAFLVVSFFLGCIQPTPTLPPAPRGLARVAVAPPVDGTGSGLVVENPGLVGRLLDVPRVTVPDLLGTDLRDALNQRGFDVAGSAAGSVPALQTEIRRWEPYSADYSMVMVDLVASLVESSSGRELWRAERAGWRVPTPDARSSYEASVAAASAIAATLLDGWQPSE